MAEPRQRRSHSILPGDVADREADPVKVRNARRKGSAAPRSTKQPTSPHVQRSQLEKYSTLGIVEDASAKKFSSKSHFVTSKDRRDRRKRGASHRNQSSERVAAMRAAGLTTSVSSGGTLPRGGGNPHTRAGLLETQSSSLTDSHPKGSGDRAESTRQLRTDKKRYHRSRKEKNKANEIRKQKMRKEIISELTTLLCADCKVAVETHNETAAEIAKEWREETDKVSTILKRLTSLEDDDVDDAFWDEGDETLDDKESGKLASSTTSHRSPNGASIKDATPAAGDATPAMHSMHTADWIAKYGELTPTDLEKGSEERHVRDGWHISPDGTTMSLLGLPPIPLGHLSPKYAPDQNGKFTGNEGHSSVVLDPERAAAEERRCQQEKRDAEARAALAAKKAENEPGKGTVDDVIRNFVKSSNAEHFSLAQNPLHSSPPPFVACVLPSKESTILETEVRQLSQRLNDVASALAKLNKASPVLPPPAVRAYLELVGLKDKEGNAAMGAIANVGKSGSSDLKVVSSKPIHKRSHSNLESPPIEPSPRRKESGDRRRDAKAGKSRKKKNGKAVDIRGGSNYLLGASVDMLCSEIHVKEGALPPTLDLVVTFLSNHDVLATPGLFADMDDPPPELDEMVEQLNEDLAGMTGCNLDKFGAKTVAAFFLRFFLELQEPLLPFGNYAVAMKVPNIEDRQFRVSALHSVVMSLPPKRRLLLTSLVCWCELVLSHKESNGASAEGLATRFGPLIVRPPFTQWLRPAKNRALLRVAAAHSRDDHARKTSNAEELAVALSLAPHSRMHVKMSKAEVQTTMEGGNMEQNDESKEKEEEKEGEDLEKALRQYGKPSSKFFVSLLENSHAIFHSFPEYGAWQEQQMKTMQRKHNKQLDSQHMVLEDVSAKTGNGCEQGLRAKKTLAHAPQMKFVNSWIIDEDKGASVDADSPRDTEKEDADEDTRKDEISKDLEGDGKRMVEVDEKRRKDEGSGKKHGDEEENDNKESFSQPFSIGMLYVPVNTKKGGNSGNQTEEKGSKPGDGEMGGSRLGTGPDLDTPRVLLQAATLDHIVQKMMDGVYIKCVEKSFDCMILATHLYFTTPSELLDHIFAVLIGRLEADGSVNSNAWIRTQGCSSVLHLIETWIRDYSAFGKVPLSDTPAFGNVLEMGLAHLVEIFASSPSSRKGPSPLELQCDDIRNLWTQQKKKEKRESKTGRKKKGNPMEIHGKLMGLPCEDSLAKNTFLTLEPETIAQALTHRAATLFSGIPHHELIGLRFQDPHSEFAKSTVEYNLISFWVGTQVLLLCDPKHRAKVLSHFILIALALKRLGNFDSLSAIVSGLQNTPVERLEQSWKLVEKGLRKKFQGLKEITDPAMNFQHYRQDFANQEPPKLPILAVLSTDLIAIHEQKNVLPAPVSSMSNLPLVHVDKLRAVYGVVESQFLQLGYKGTPSTDDFPYNGKLGLATKDVLKKLAKQLSPTVIAGEKELFDASKRAEPRK